MAPSGFFASISELCEKINNLFRVESLSGQTKQILTGYFGSISMLACMASYVWITPAIVELANKGGPIGAGTTAIALMAAVPELFAAVAAPVAGALADFLGRRPILLACGPMGAASHLVVYFTTSTTILVLVRVLQGLIFGLVLAVLPMYLGEISQAEKRSSVVNSCQLCFQLGTLYALVVGSFASYRLLTLLCIIPYAAFTFLFSLCAESPHFWLLRGNRPRAVKCLVTFRDKGWDIESELDKMAECLKESSERIGYRILLKTKAGRKSLLIVLLAPTLLFMCGAMPMLDYAAQQFVETTGQPDLSNLFTIIIGLLSCVSTALGPMILKRFGKRRSVIAVHLVAVPLFIATAVFYYLDRCTAVEVHSWSLLPLVCISLLYVLLYLLTVLVLRSYQSELFSTPARSCGSFTTTVSICLSATASIFLFSYLYETEWLFIVYAIFLCFDIALILFFWLYVPETNGLTFEEIQDVLSGNQIKHSHSEIS